MGTKICLEDCTVLYVARLQNALTKQINKEFLKPLQAEFVVRMDEELRKFKANDQSFDYVSVPNQYGGKRWFFLCPKCGKKAFKLFLPPKESGYEPYYYCKACHKIKNRSSIMGATKVYKEFYRPLKRIKEIEKKLEHGRHSPEEIKTLLDEYEKLENELKNSPNFRLHAFRAKHGTQS